MNRRTFLKGSATMATLALPVSPARFGEGLQIAILGSGIAGLGAALHLQQARMDYKIFEASPRLGGRIWTENRFNSDGQFVELGGELINRDHRSIIQMARSLGLSLDRFPTGPEAQSKELYYFGGQRYSSVDLAAGLEPLVRFCRHAYAELRSGISDSDDLGYAHRAHPGVVKYDRMSLSHFLDSVPDLEAWVKEAVRVGYVCEFGLDAEEQTSINLLEMFDTDIPGRMLGSSDEGLRITGGTGLLIAKMFERACPRLEADEHIHLNHELVRIRERGRKIELTFRNDLSSKTIKVDRVICTIPFSVLRRIDGVSQLNLSEVKKRSILELGYGTNSKLTMDFQLRFWNQSPVTTSTALMTDLGSQSYWESSRVQSGARGLLTNFRGGRRGADADESNVARNVAELREIYGGPGASQYFSKAVVTNWFLKEFQRGSYSCMRPGQVTRCWGENHIPELDERLIFAGEHTSLEATGYMEGSLSSGLRAARQVLNSVSFWS